MAWGEYRHLFLPSSDAAIRSTAAGEDASKWCFSAAITTAHKADILLFFRNATERISPRAKFLEIDCEAEKGASPATSAPALAVYRGRSRAWLSCRGAVFPRSLFPTRRRRGRRGIYRERCMGPLGGKEGAAERLTRGPFSKAPWYSSCSALACAAMSERERARNTSARGVRCRRIARCAKGAPPLIERLAHLAKGRLCKAARKGD